MERERKNLLVFGYGLPLILTFFSVRLGMKHGFGFWNYTGLGVAAFMIVITVFYLPVLRTIYIYWMKVVGRIGHVVTLLLLSTIFYVIFGVVGIILRILRKDLLDQAISKETKSYWQLRTLTPFNKESYTKQF